MPDIDAWAGNSFPLSAWLDDVDAGVDTARLIADKGTSITAVRGGSELSAQTVRLEELSRERTVETDAGRTATVDTLVLGYKGHPSIADTDLQRGDRFAAAGLGYEVMAIVPGLVDSFQAYAKVRS